MRKRSGAFPEPLDGPAEEAPVASVLLAVAGALLAGAAAALTAEQVGMRLAARRPVLAPELLVLAPLCLGALAASAVAEIGSPSRRPWFALVVFAPVSAAYGWFAAAGALTHVASHTGVAPTPRACLVAGGALLAVLGALAGWCVVRRTRNLPTPRRAPVTMAACLLPLVAVALAVLARALLTDLARPERLAPAPLSYASASIWWAVAAVLVGAATRLPQPAFWLGGAAATGSCLALLPGVLAGRTNAALAAICALAAAAVAVGLVLLVQAAAEAHSEAAAAAPKRHEADREASRPRRRPIRRLRRPGRFDPP